MAELLLPEVSPGEPAISGLMSGASRHGLPPSLDAGQYSYNHPLSYVWVFGQPGRYGRRARLHRDRRDGVTAAPTVREPDRDRLQTAPITPM